MAVILGFWAIIPVLFTYATSRISATQKYLFTTEIQIYIYKGGDKI
jgi:hypothetical protein